MGMAAGRKCPSADGHCGHPAREDRTRDPPGRACTAAREARAQGTAETQPRRTVIVDLQRALDIVHLDNLRREPAKRIVPGQNWCVDVHRDATLPDA